MIPTNTLDCWYKYYPLRFNRAVLGLSNDVIAVYHLVLNEMAICDNMLKDNDQRIAKRIGQSLRLYRRVKRELIELGKLYVENGVLRNPKADEVLGERQIMMARKSEEQRDRANKRWDIEAQRADVARQAPMPAPRPRGHVSLNDVMDETGNIPLAKLHLMGRIDGNRVVSSAPSALKINETGMQREMQNVPLPKSIKLEPEDAEFLAQKAKAVAYYKRLAEMDEIASQQVAADMAKTKENRNRGFSQAPKSLKTNETAMQSQSYNKEDSMIEESSSYRRESYNCNERAISESDSEKFIDPDSCANALGEGRGCASAHMDSEGEAESSTESRVRDAVHEDSEWIAASARARDKARLASMLILEEQEEDSDGPDSIQESVRILRDLMARCGVDEARCFWHSARIREWLAAGVSEATICRVVDDVLKQARRSNPGFVPQSLKYFDRAMDVIIERRVA